MSDVDTASVEALQQALSQTFADNGDVVTAKAGQTEATVKLIPDKEQVKPEAAATNEEAKAKRKSDAEWQKMQEAATKGEKAAEKMQKLQDALKDAPAEVQQEPDTETKVKKLTELIERKDWEADHPTVRNEKYRVAWKQVNEDPVTAPLSYDEKSGSSSRTTPRPSRRS